MFSDLRMNKRVRKQHKAAFYFLNVFKTSVRFISIHLCKSLLPPHLSFLHHFLPLRLSSSFIHNTADFLLSWSFYWLQQNKSVCTLISLRLTLCGVQWHWFTLRNLKKLQFGWKLVFQGFTVQQLFLWKYVMSQKQ